MVEPAIQETSINNRANEILLGLAAGKTRSQVAQELKYKNYKGLDIYMKRNNFEWDNKRNYYFPAREKESLQDKLMHHPEGRVMKILSMLKTGLGIKEISVQLKFHDHREMALFMKSKGYIWNEKDQTYHLVGQIGNGELQEERKLVEELTYITRKEGLKNLGSNRGDISMSEQSAQVISFFENNKEILYQLVSAHTNIATIPRYIIPGVCTTKSIHMNYGLDQLIREYSQEKNVSQKDVFEVALIDFFKKYGFQNEISTLIAR